MPLKSYYAHGIFHNRHVREVMNLAIPLSYMSRQTCLNASAVPVPRPPSSKCQYMLTSTPNSTLLVLVLDALVLVFRNLNCIFLQDFHVLLYASFHERKLLV